jgi:hypothetical protein
MFQLQDSLGWSNFQMSNQFHISDCIEHLAQITNREVSQMCVILCIDGMQKLDHRPGSRYSDFYNTTSSICSVINSNRSFIIVISSATVYNVVNEILSSGAQRRVYLTPLPVNPEHIFEAKDELIH